MTKRKLCEQHIIIETKYYCYDGEHNNNKSRRINECQYIDKQNDDKNLCNQFVTNYMQGDWNILVLDGKNLRTSNMLIQNGIKPEKITVIERDKAVFQKMEDANLGIILYNMSLEKYVKTYSMRRFQMVYFDFCCTVTGSRANDEFPLEVISKFLEKNARGELIMAFTFSRRCKYASEKHGAKEFLEEAMRFQQYDTEILAEYNYQNSGNMAFYVFKLIKNRKIDPELVRFDWDKKNKCCVGYRENDDIIEVTRRKRN